jgi:hypothetical protein
MRRHAMDGGGAVSVAAEREEFAVGGRARAIDGGGAVRKGRR